MTPRRKTSRRRSAANSSAEQPESVLYLDESIFSRVLCDALEPARVSVKRPGIDIPFGTPDKEWLLKAGAERWIVLMRDQRIRHRVLEIQSLREARVGAFVFTAGEATAQTAAAVILSRLQKILNIARSERRPFLYMFGIGGAFSRFKIRIR